MTKHTPGPWILDEESIDLLDFELETHRIWINADGMHIGYVDGPRTEERKANARLIAAAPDLLEALKEIVKSLADQDDEGMIEHVDPMIKARAAIAKATGNNHE